jgi:serine protease Do
MRRRFLIAVLVVACSPVPPTKAETGETRAAAPAHATALAEPAKLSQLELSFERVAETAGPSVVSITSVRVHKPTERVPGPQFRSPFDEFFFGDPFRDHFDQAPESGRREQGLGSGFIVDAAGYILTNNHVVDGADELTVHFTDDRQVKAKVIGTDPKSDLAVIKVDGKDLKPLLLGDSDNLRVGQWVVAIGAPFGLEQSVTAGIVSAKGRSNVGIVDYEDMIQTDAAINPGNSGGPLLNLEGKVVGINTAIASRSGGYQGIGFAIPISMARAIMKQLIDNGKVVRGWLGVAIQKLTPELSRSFDYKGTGIVVADVTSDTPAAKAGLESGDIIVSLDGQQVRDVSAFRNRIAQLAPGTKIDLEVVRGGKTKKMGAQVGEQPATFANRGPQNVDVGLELSDASPDLKRQFDLPEKAIGAVIVQVTPGSVAARAGLRPGMVITEVDRHAIKNAADAKRHLGRGATKKGVLLRVVDREGSRFIVLGLGEE